MAESLGRSKSAIRRMARNGRLKSTRCNDKGERIFAPLWEQPEPVRRQATDHAGAQISQDMNANHARGAV